MSENNTSSGGIGFVGILTILFIALKLTGYISWSWLLVLSPLLISAGIGVLVAIVIFIIAAIKS
jgi:hypothetical protein